MQARLRKLDKKRAGSDASDSESDVDDRPTKKRSGPSFLEQELAKYSSARQVKGKRGKRDEDDLLSALSSFAGKIRQAEGGEEEVDRAEDDQEVDDDVDWIGHKLRAAKDDGSESRRAESDYTVSSSSVRL
jgi:peptidyl-prolyl cis-trans isomerase SDCCAG10